MPDQVEFHINQSCVMRETTNAYSGQTSYKEELSLSVLETSGKLTNSAQLTIDVITCPVSISSNCSKIQILVLLCSVFSESTF